ncbi:prohead [Acinetobacter phage Acj9]|uniref:Gp67 prohead core protein n=1 Tax=Acinetobacter phage Acj9 TaxID=760939 RepID=E5EPW5_9CAUD|nr:prohead [Acinetobacter phage Acj9]ADG60081.1 gp67 prohead core protein [Acinetobacter phage Acj9]
MSDVLVNAIASNDLVKFKQCFAESMKGKVEAVLQERKLEIARSVMVEGEEPNDDDDENEPDEGEQDTK